MIFAHSQMIWVAVLAFGLPAQEMTWEDLIDQGRRLEAAGQYNQAASLYRAAERKVDSPGDIRFAQTLHILANSEANAGRLGDAERDYLRALVAAESVAGKQSPEYSVVLTSLAVNHWESGDGKRAEAMLRQAIGLYRSTVSGNDPRLAVARSSLAAVLLSRGRHAEAEQLLEHALDVFRASPEAYSAQTVAALSDLAMAKMQAGARAAAAEISEEAIRTAEQNFGPYHPLLIRPLDNFAVISELCGRRETAKAAFERAIGIAARVLGTEHPNYGGLLLNYANFERRSGHKLYAKALEAKARSVLRASAARNGVGMTVDVSGFRRGDLPPDGHRFKKRRDLGRAGRPRRNADD
jgi:tetratricopeptide (TPR) repeat protein